MTEVSAVLSVSGSRVLDGNGHGTIDFDVDNAWQRWDIDAVVVSTSQGISTPPYPRAEVFIGPAIAPAFSQGATWTGNQDTFKGLAELDSGNEMHVVFTAGIPGTTAFARVSGTKYTRIE